jgi:hypothetical protein
VFTQIVLLLIRERAKRSAWVFQATCRDACKSIAQWICYLGNAARNLSPGAMLFIVTKQILLQGSINDKDQARGL